MNDGTATPKRPWRWIIAAGLAVVLVAAGVVVAVVAGDNEPEVTVEDVSTDPEPFAGYNAFGSIFGGVAGGAEYTVGSDLMTWFLSGVFGIGSGDPLSGPFQQIQADIAQLSAELGKIAGELEQLDCDQTKTGLNPSISAINGWYDRYNTWAQDASSGAGPPDSDVTSWANEVMDPTTGVLNAVENIKAGALSAAEANGTIAACLIAANGSTSNESISPYLPGTKLGDTAYYSNIVQPIVAYYLNLVTEAMTLYAEAQHWRGWVAAGSPTGSSDDVITDICGAAAPSTTTTTTAASSTTTSSSSTTTSTTSPASTTTSSTAPTNSAALVAAFGSGGTTTTTSAQPASFYCIDPQSYLGVTIEPLIVALFEEGGAPYDSDTVVMANGEVNGTHYLLARSIEQFNEASGASCPSTSDGTLTQTCGPTVGTYDRADFLPYDYAYTDVGGTWAPAPQGVFQGALAGFLALSESDTTLVGDWLCYQVSSSKNPSGDCTGVEKAYPKVVFFPETVTTDKWGPTICFMDGSLARNQVHFQPFCSSTGVDVLMNVNGDKGCSKGGGSSSGGYLPDHEWTGDLESSQTDNQGFYEARASGTGKTEHWCIAPGWAESSGYATFRWPALDTSQIQCTVDNFSGGRRENLNPAGVPTMCGEDLDTFIAQFTGSLG